MTATAVTQSNARAAGRMPIIFWYIFAVKHNDNEKAIDIDTRAEEDL